MVSTSAVNTPTDQTQFTERDINWSDAATDLGVSGNDVKTCIPLACDRLCCASRHQQLVNVVIQQVLLQILRTPETAQAVQVLNTYSTHQADISQLTRHNFLHIQFVGMEPNKLNSSN